MEMYHFFIGKDKVRRKYMDKILKGRAFEVLKALEFEEYRYSVYQYRVRIKCDWMHPLTLLDRME